MASVNGATSAQARDRDWVRKSFMLSSGDMNDAMRAARVYTSASEKFTNAEVGGNFPINTPPQYTRYADIRAGKRSRSSRDGGSTNIGMGRFYSEQLDDNLNLVNMRFGVPSYNGLLTFFTGFYNNDHSRLARETRGLQIAYLLGKVIGAVVAWQFRVWIIAGYAARFMFGRPSSKYYFLKPSMALYWNRVNFIANSLAVNMGIVPRPAIADSNDETEDKPKETSKEYAGYANRASPDVYRPDGSIDVYSVANRAHRMAYMRYEERRKIAETATSEATLAKQLKNWSTELVTEVPSEGIEAYLSRYNLSALGDLANAENEKLTEKFQGDLNAVQAPSQPTDAPPPVTDPATPPPVPAEKPVPDPSVTDKLMLSKWVIIAATAAGAVVGGPVGAAVAAGAAGAIVQTDTYQAVSGWGGQLQEHMVSDIKQGSAFVTIAVQPTGTSSESFSNSTKDADVAGMINGASSTARNVRFTFSDGNSGIGLVDEAIATVKNVVTGFLDGVALSGLMALAGSAFVDIPKHWDSSSMSGFNSQNFSFQLRPWAGNKMSRYQQMMIPLSMLLAAALPLSTGRQSYTSPFLCEMYYRGRNQVRLGMITDLSITRGEGTMGWNNHSEMLGLDVSFTVADMSSVMHAPIGTGITGISSLWSGIFDDDSAFNDYLATLGNLSMADQIYPSRKLAINLAKKKLELSSYFSRSHFSNAFGNGWAGGLLNNLSAPITGFGGSNFRA